MKRSSEARLACFAVTATLGIFADFTCLNVCLLTVWKKPKRQKGQGLALILFTKIRTVQGLQRKKRKKRKEKDPSDLKGK